MSFELVYYPDPRLREVSRPVKALDDEVRALVPVMFEVMYKARGIGLAGPQVGELRRIIVANLLHDPRKKEGEQVFINPEIVEKDGEMREEEGCLSLPGMVAVLPRAEKVEVRYQDFEGKTVQRQAEALEAKLLQHEIDHLDGILILDKMTAADKKQWAPLLKELEEEFADKVKKRKRRGGHDAPAL